jgi:hypothetical protein
VRARTAWLAGAAGTAVALYRKLRRQPPAEQAPAEDPRAEDLRQRLEESRTVAEEQHEEAASPEVPVDAVAAPEPEPRPEPEPGEVEDRRRAVHDRARAAADEMRGERSDGE